jgi:PAS domain S-box-containing protein
VGFHAAKSLYILLDSSAILPIVFSPSFCLAEFILMSDEKNPKQASITEEYLKVVDELVKLEELNLGGGLSQDQKQRWKSLTGRLFGQGSMQDRRQFFRVQTQRTAQVQVKDAKIDADVTSLSAGGLFLRTDQVSKDMVGEDLQVAVQFPQVGERIIHFKVQVCWVADPQQSDTPGMGVRFLEMDSAQRRFVLDHLRTYLVDLIDLSREKYHFFFEHSADATLLLSPEGNIIEVSEATLAFLQRKAEDLTGKSIVELVPSGERPSLLAALERIQQHEVTRLSLQLIGADGQLLPVEARITPFLVKDLMIGAMVIAHDLREQRRLQEKQRAMERRLFQADKLATIGQITASIAHDINNPLAYVMTNLSLLSEYVHPLKVLIHRALEEGDNTLVPTNVLENIDKDLGDLVSECQVGSTRIRDILLDIRSFSRLDSQAEVRVDLNQALDGSVRIVKTLINHRARLECEYGTNLPSTYLNFGRLMQVLLNLLTNAAQSFETQDIQRNRIWLSTRLVEDKLCVTISDNGRGIPPEIQELIFEPFFTTRREEGGTGLGLAIARECIETLGGTLAMESAPGKGTSFTLSFPIRRGTPPSLPMVNPSPPQTRPRVLIIDDDQTLMKSIERTLSRSFEVTAVTSPIEALDLASRQVFDCILCDVMMPEMGGLVFREKLASLNPALAQKIVFMTGGTFQLEEERALAAQNNPVLLKPIEVPRLLAVLERCADCGKK